MILVDDRTGSIEIAPLIQTAHGTCRLEYGDFSFAGNGPEGPVSVGVERKSLLDLIQSMVSGRLSGHQLIGLKSQYDWVYIVVEGYFRPNKDGILMRITKGFKWVPVEHGSRKFMVRDVYSFINTLSTICGVQVVLTGSKHETAHWLDSTYRWWNKKWTDHKSHLQFQKREEVVQLVRPSLVTRMVSQIDGIGIDKAREIGRVYVTPKDLFMAREWDLSQVKGIGKELAHRIYTQINGG